MLKSRIRSKKLIALVLISTILIQISVPLLSEFFNLNGSKKKSDQNINSANYNSDFDHFLYVNNVDSTEYYFNAKGECYILIEIEDIDFTYFELDGQIINVSYGLNILPVKFPDSFTSHQITLIPEYFKSLTIEPLFLADGTLETSLNQDSEINFQAGGPISILVRPTFAYNWLNLELLNQTGSSTLLKRIHDTAEYPEIDPLFYCLLIERGTYIRYDINLDPGEYRLLLKGDGSLEYKIMVNLDWDEDLLDDVDEIQQEGLYEFSLSPTSADIWGFYEKSSDNQIFTRVDETKYTEGLFTFYIPEQYPDAEVAIRVNSGEFKEIVVDGNDTIFEDKVLITDLDSPPDYEIYGNLESGWHSISYIYKSNFTADIDFLAKDEEIKVLMVPEFLDSDGDGFKDFAETRSGLDPSKSDTDDDELPDNFDSSPLAKVELDPLEINQVIIPTNEEKNTIINIHVKKPTNDYSTYGVPRYWNNIYNVSIYPVLRLFGNKFNTDDGTKEDMNRAKMVELWGKDVSLLFKSDENFDETQIGDPLPDSDDPDNEYYFIFPKSAETNFEYDITIPKEHSSKSDGFLDLRFDFIWLITKYDSYTKETSLLHFYNFDENIIIQSMAMREFLNIDYILGSPDNFIENQILWTLTQNPSLGTPGQYNVNDDIIGKGNIDYLSLPEQLIQDKRNNVEEINQTEVLYIAGLYQNYDILNKIHFKGISNLPFEIEHSGDFESFFSYYTISNVYSDSNYTFGDLEIQGENKILYQTYYTNLSVNSNTNIQKRASIMGIPIAMERSENVLKISQAQGVNIPLGEIPSLFNSQLSANIVILEQTYIEQEDGNQGIALLNFQVGVDIYKEFIDNRQDTVVLSDAFFTYQPYMPAESFQNFISNYIDQINTFNNYLHLLKDLLLSSSDNEVYIELIDNMIIDVNLFIQQHSYSDLSYYNSFFSFGRNLNDDFEELLETDQVATFFEVVSPAFIGDVGELTAKISEALADQVAERGPKVAKFNQHKQNNNKMQNSIKSQGRMSKITTFSGATCVVLGIAMIIFTFVEVFHLIGQKLTGEYNVSDTQFAMRMCSAFCTIALGTIILVKGMMLLSMKSVKEATVSTLKSAGKVLGAIGIVLSILIVVFDWVSFAIKWEAGDIYDLKGALFDMIANTVLAAVGIILCLTVSGIGAAFGIIVGGLLILGSWISSKINNPSIDVIEENCKVIFPAETQLNMRRHGGLEVGDQIGFKFHVVEDGDTVVYMRARFRAVSESWVSAWDGWHGEWDSYCSKILRTFYATIEGPTHNVGFQFHFQMDWQKFTWYIFWFSFSREFGCNHLITEFLDLPALENSISEFYANTHEISTQVFKQLYAQALSEYRYKDAAYAAVKVMQTSEQLAGMSTYYFYYSFLPRLVWFGDTLSHFMIATSSQSEYNWLLTKFISEGVVPSFFLYYFTLNDLNELTEKHLQDLLSFALELYYYTGGILLVPVGFVNVRHIYFADYNAYSVAFGSLPIYANFRVNMIDDIIKINPYLGYGEASLEFDVDWYHPWLKYPDRIYQYKIIAPEGFSIGPKDTFTDNFPAKLDFNVIQEIPDLIGTFEFIIQIYYGSNLVYQESVPFYIEPLYTIELITHTSEDPIVPGQFFTAVYVNNTGTLAVRVGVSVEGISDNFIYKELYPNVYYENELVSGYIDNTLIIGLNPGEVKEVFIIHPPRDYSTQPGPYTYTVYVEDLIYSNFYHEFTDTFIVDEFYDMEFQVINPEITIFDYQTDSYTFELTNFGNVPQEFQISFDDIPFANEFLSEDIIYLGPGETQVITLAIIPTSWGEQEFSINAISEYNSSSIIDKIIINDDDVNPPKIANFEIIDTPIDITVNFNIPNEKDGDDEGISNIKIFIDDDLILEYIPNPKETCFSFTFNDTHGNWFMKKGTHEIRVEIIDNDFDVPNDALNSSILGTFETELKDIYFYVDWQIEVLKNYTDTHLCWLMDKLLNHKLSMAQKHLEKAYDLVEKGTLTCGLFHDAVAKIMIEITEFRTEIFNKINFISDEDATYIISSLHTIRNNIVLLIGTTSGTEHGIPLALIEINLLNLNDFIEDEINWWDRKCLTCYIDSAAKSLEIAIFKASMDRDLECVLSCTQWKLELVTKKVNCLLNKEEISKELANAILNEIDQVQDDIEAVKNSL